MYIRILPNLRWVFWALVTLAALAATVLQAAQGLFVGMFLTALASLVPAFKAMAARNAQ